MFSTKIGVTMLSLVVVIGLVVLKVVVAVKTESISIAAQTVDSFLDLFATAVILFAVGVAIQSAGMPEILTL